jgi:integrase
MAGDVVMPANFDKSLDAVAERAGWKAGETRSRIFRNTFVAARLQTLDGGAPISPFTVAREVGHADLEMVSAIYGHSGVVRHRSDVVEYLVEQHRDQVQERFGVVVTTILSPHEKAESWQGR